MAGGLRFPAEEIVNMGGMEITATYSQITVNSGLSADAIK
jgi:hypothetical protein